MKYRLISITAAALAFLAAAGTTFGGTLDVYVDPSTWVIDHTSGSGVWWNAKDVVASTTNQYGQTITRHYTYGSFNAVNIWNNNNQSEQLWSSGTGGCNNIFYIVRAAQTAYVCGTGYNGTGNGTTGEILVGAAFSNGDFYIGGSFTTAGGYSYTSNFSCYRWTDGWSGVNGVYASGTVNSFSWSNYKLVVSVSGGSPYVYGPLSQGGSSGQLNGATAYWNDYYKTFPNGWWTSN